LPNDKARELRKRLTPQEVKLWVKLRELKPLGFHFRRQAPIGSYIVDFVSFSARIVIEVDGGQHGMQKAFGQMVGATRSFDRMAFVFFDSGIRTSIKV